MPHWRPVWLSSARPTPCCLLPRIRRKACRRSSRNAARSSAETDYSDQLNIPAQKKSRSNNSKRDFLYPRSYRSRVKADSTTGAPRSLGTEVTGRQPPLIEEIALGLLVDQVERQVTACLQVMVQTYTRLPGLGFRCVVVVDHRRAPQSASGIVVIAHHHQPGILIHVHVPFGIQVAIVVLDVGFQH